MKTITHKLLFISSVLLLTSCTMGTPADDSPVLAVVGGETLTLKQALQEIPEIVILPDTLSAISDFQQTWIESRVLLREANRLGIQNTPEVRNRVERIRAQIMQETLKELILSQNKDELFVSRDEAQNYYQENKERFTLEERFVRFRHISTRTRVDADNARRDIMRGIPWTDVAQRYSVNPELQIRQSNQFWPISMAVADIPVMNRYLNVIGITEISPIQAHGNLFHFVQLREDRPIGDHPDLDWLIDQITVWLRLEKSRRLINSYVRNLYLQAEANNEIEKTNVSALRNVIITYIEQTDEVPTL